MARQFDSELVIEEVGTFRVIRFIAAHEVAQPAVIDVEAVWDGYADLGALVGRAAELFLGERGGERRSFFGVVEAATVIGGTERGGEERGTHYRLQVVSVLALLARSTTSRIFQDKTVPEIVTQVLADHGITKVDLRLGGYTPRTYCVQYQESALDFVSRLLEHEGIHHFVEPHPEGGELIVLADESASAPFISGDPELAVQPRSALLEGADAIYAVRPRARVRSGKFVLRDFDFLKPQLDLTAQVEAKANASLEVYDYPGGYVDPAQGKRLAQVRLQAEQVEARTVEIDAVCARLAAGHRIRVADAGDLDGEYFVLAVTHTYDDRKERRTGQPRYVARARLLPATDSYRPPRRTPIPVIAGVQTATVVAPAGAPSESIHTDEHGRCKVRFHWDTSGVTDDRASCWMRVMQLQTSGSVVLPRVGWEVVVEFLEGDPDRPILTGRLYNGMFMPPYALPEGKTRTSIRTASTPGGGGANEIRFEDRAGAEEIMLHAQRDMKVVAANNAKRTVGNNETSVVGNSASLQVSGAQTTKITKGHSTTIGGGQSVLVGGNRSVEVNAVSAVTAHGSSTTTVGGNQFEMDGNPLEAMLALAAQAAAEFATAVADNAVAAVQASVDGAINQVMGPINALNAQVQGIGQAMQAAAQGDLSQIGAAVAGASGLPGASELAASFAGGGTQGGGGQNGAGTPFATPLDGAIAAGAQANAMTAMAANAARGVLGQGIAQGMGAAHDALAGALGFDGAGGGGESMANAGGPDGDVAGIDATDREKGPGHSTAKVAGSHTETIGSMKVLAAVQSIDTNVGGSKTVDVGLGTLELAIGDCAETVGGSKTEDALGLVVLSKAGESETVAGSKTTMVGGAIIDKIDRSQVIQAGGPATFVGAFHKIEAQGAIVFKCGASEVVIGGGGISITSPIVVFLAPTIQLPGKVLEI